MMPAMMIPAVIRASKRFGRHMRKRASKDYMILTNIPFSRGEIKGGRGSMGATHLLVGASEALPKG